jgi:hypothetical protein
MFDSDCVETKLVIDAAYQHRKGGNYWLIAIAQPVASAVEIPEHLRSYSVMHSETEAVFEVYGVGLNAFYIADSNSPKLAIYQAIGGKPSKAPAGRWGRPLDMFCDGRFTLLESVPEPHS